MVDPGNDQSATLRCLRDEVAMSDDDLAEASQGRAAGGPALEVARVGADSSSPDRESGGFLSTFFGPETIDGYEGDRRAG